MAEKPGAFRWLRLTEEAASVPSLEQRCAALAAGRALPARPRSLDRVTHAVDEAAGADCSGGRGGDEGPKLKAA